MIRLHRPFLSRPARRLGLTALALFGGVAAAAAQGSSANAGAITWSGNVDVPSAYVFRGLVQELEPAVTVQPSGELAVSLAGQTRLHLGTWHSLQTGSSGSDGPTGRLHYEERFLAGVSLPAAFGTTLTASYTAYTAPGNLFETRHELGFRLASRQRFAPYALVAVELKGAADRVDTGSGSYLELGAAPAFRTGVLGATLSVPVRVGLSLSNYYEGFDGDHRFGFFDAGGLVTIPLGGNGRYGRWNLHGGANVYRLGDTPKIYNDGKSTKLVATVGLGLHY